MIKEGVIKPGVTPPENESNKSAADLEDHATTRLSDKVADEIKQAESAS
jgi:hypothetical protein